MYRYDDHDHAIVHARVEQFRDQTRRYLAGTLSEDEFRPLRLQNGLYVEKNGPMLRVAVPYGVLAARQLRKLADVARRYDRGVGHFTTRHNLQLNWVKIAEVPELLAELATVEMHAIQTSGNVIRNVTTDHLAGIAPDEIADPRPWAEILRQWSALHPEFAYLPRKFKIAITGAAEDRAVIRVHDVGLQLVRDETGSLGFRVFAGGGLGRTPVIGEPVKDFLPWPHLLSYLEALVRVFNRYGRRDNIYKARIKILVKALGAAEFARQVDEEWAHLKGGPATLIESEVAHISAHFAPPAYATLPADDLCHLANLREDRIFARWVGRNVHGHKVPGYAAVTLSLKKIGSAPGDATSEQMEAAADLAERYSFGELRVSHEQNLVLPDVPQRELYTVWHLARAAGLASPTVGLLADLIACPGGDFCELASTRVLPVAAAIQDRFEDLDYLYDIGELELNISGCVNACGHHHIGHIGILGVDKQGEEWYQVSIGGRQGNALGFGEVIGPAFAADEVPDVVERLVDTYLAHRHGGERFIDTVGRIGLDPFRVRAYQLDSDEREVANA
jgi:sulfite reductase (NADPH) hemoprotein beta-component